MVADTHGIVYTPQPIVGFHVRARGGSAAKASWRVLTTRAMADSEPCTGTGNFHRQPAAAHGHSKTCPHVKEQLFANEVMLLRTTSWP